jgi:hypothetical protein
MEREGGKRVLSGSRRDPEEVFRPGQDASDALGIFGRLGGFEGVAGVEASTCPALQPCTVSVVEPGVTKAEQAVDTEKQ